MLYIQSHLQNVARLITWYLGTQIAITPGLTAPIPTAVVHKGRRVAFGTRLMTNHRPRALWLVADIAARLVFQKKCIPNVLRGDHAQFLALSWFHLQDLDLPLTDFVAEPVAIKK